jgi:microcompartment protein CcmK/EutM
MELTLEGGKINVDFEGESMDVRQDQNDASFGTFTIVATAEDVDVDTMDFALHKTANTFVLEDMKLRDKNGRGTYSLEAPAAIGLAATSSTVRVENLSLEQGVTYEFEVIADVPSTATSNYSYYFTWAAAGVDAEGVSSDNSIEADDFSSSALTGPTVDVDTSSLVVRSSALSDDTVVNGTENVLLFRGTLEAGNTSDITISSITLATGTSAGEDWANRLNGVKLFIVGLNETVDPTEDTPVATDNTVSGNEAILDGVDVTIQSGSANRMKFEVYGDITDGSTTGDIDMALTAVDATDEDDEDVDAEGSTGVAVSTTAIQSDRVLTIASTGTLSMVVDLDYTGLNNDRYALAGTEKYLAGRVKLQADQENVELRDLALRFVTNTGATTYAALDSTIDSINLYSNPSMADNTLLGTADFAATTTIEDVNYTVVDGTASYLYVGLKLNSVGTDSDGTAVVSTSFKFKVDGAGHDVVGASSNDDITPTVTQTLTNDITVVPVKITNVASTFSSGNLIGGNQNIFSFTVTADAGRNTDADGDVLSAHLTRMKLQLSTDVGDGVTSNTSALQLCRVDSGNCIDLAGNGIVSGTNSTISLQTAGDGYVDLTDFTDANDEYVDAGETVEFVVKGTFANTTDKFVQVKILDLNSSGLVYAVDTTADGTDDYYFYDIRKDAPRGTDYPNVTGGSLN